VGEGREILGSEGRLGYAPRDAFAEERGKPVAERFRLIVNGTESELEASPDTPLLYALRNDLRLIGTRFGCGNEECGACFVLVDGRAVAFRNPSDAIAAGIGMVHQHFMLVESMTVLENLMLGQERGLALRHGKAAAQSVQFSVGLAGI